jgi:hypothetical protein
LSERPVTDFHRLFFCSRHSVAVRFKQFVFHKVEYRPLVGCFIENDFKVSLDLIHVTHGAFALIGNATFATAKPSLGLGAPDESSMVKRA